MSLENAGKPWPPEDETRAMLAGLSLWYTLEETGRLVGRTTLAVRRRMNLLKIPVRWRKNHGGHTARCWTTPEKVALYDLCHKRTQAEVADMLGMSRAAINCKWREEGVRWGQGRISLADLARLAGCSPQWVSKRAKEIFGGQGLPRVGTGKGIRWRLTVDQAARVMGVVRPGRVPKLLELYGDGDRCI